MSKPSKKSIIAEAAGLIVVEQGSLDITLEAVAKRANVSKGGLLYHFPTKDALIYGAIEHLMGELDELIALEMSHEIATTEMPETGRWLRAYVRVSTTVQTNETAASRAIVGISLTDIKFLPLMEQMYERIVERALNDGISREVADLVCIAADGCWLYGLLNPSTDGSRLQSLRQTLLKLIDNDLKQHASPI